MEMSRSPVFNGLVTPPRAFTDPQREMLSPRTPATPAQDLSVLLSFDSPEQGQVNPVPSTNGVAVNGDNNGNGEQRSQQCTCKECGKVFNSVWYLKQHAVKHSNDRPFECKYCHKTYKFRSNLYQHKCPDRVRHLGSRLRGRGRSRVVSASGAFNHDSPSNHSSDSSSGGMEGAMSTPTRETIENSDEISAMTEEQVQEYLDKWKSKLFRCTKCRLYFPTREYLSRHMTSHSVLDSKLHCRHCSETFDSERLYAAHKNKHAPQSPNSCHKCNGVFKSRLDLRRHRSKSVCFSPSDRALTPQSPVDPLQFIDQSLDTRPHPLDNGNGHSTDSGMGSSDMSSDPSPVNSVEMGGNQPINGHEAGMTANGNGGQVMYTPLNAVGMLLNDIRSPYVVPPDLPLINTPQTILYTQGYDWENSGYYWPPQGDAGVGGGVGMYGAYMAPLGLPPLLRAIPVDVSRAEMDGPPIAATLDMTELLNAKTQFYNSSRADLAHIENSLGPNFAQTQTEGATDDYRIYDECGVEMRVQALPPMCAGENKFPCRLCLRPYTTYNGLKHHMLKQHVNNDTVRMEDLLVGVCPMCGVRCVSRRELKEHVLLMHKDDRPHECEICGKAFKRKSNLAEHMKCHDKKQYFCKGCKQSFSLRCNYLKHERRCVPRRATEKELRGAERVLHRVMSSDDTFRDSYDYDPMIGCVPGDDFDPNRPLSAARPPSTAVQEANNTSLLDISLMEEFFQGARNLAQQNQDAAVEVVDIDHPVPNPAAGLEEESEEPSGAVIPDFVAFPHRGVSVVLPTVMPADKDDVIMVDETDAGSQMTVALEASAGQSSKSQPKPKRPPSRNKTKANPNSQETPQKRKKRPRTNRPRPGEEPWQRALSVARPGLSQPAPEPEKPDADGMWPCPRCPKKFRGRNWLRQHLAFHSRAD